MTDDIDIEQTIKSRLTAIDERLDHLTAEKARIGDEIRRLREDRVPIARLAAAARPRRRKAVLGTVAQPTPDSA